VTLLLSAERVGDVVFDVGEVLGAGVGHHAVFGAAQQFVDRPVDGLAEDIPHADFGRGSVVVGPCAASAVGEAKGRGGGRAAPATGSAAPTRAAAATGAAPAESERFL